MKGIPILHVEGDCIPRAWEASLVALHEKGCDVKTQYDKPEDPPSKDATMLITITDPLKEPMIHKDFPGGPVELQEYVMEVCEGIKDHLVRDPSDANDTRWEYTYHQRLFAYTVPRCPGSRSNRDDLPKVGGSAAHQACPGDHLESVGRSRLLRSCMSAKYLVPHDPGGKPLGFEHERALPF